MSIWYLAIDLVTEGLRKATKDRKVSGGSHSYEKSFRKVIPILTGILIAGKT